MKTFLKNVAWWITICAVCAFAGIFAYLWMLVAALACSKRAWTIAVAFDQLFNAATGGDEDETISSRAYKASKRGDKWGVLVADFLEKIDPGHGERHVELNVGKPLEL